MEGTRASRGGGRLCRQSRRPQIDGEHDVLGLIGQSKPAPSFFLFFYIRTTSRASLERHLAMECSRGFRWLPSFVSPCCRHRQRFRSG
jgi:hypothetical protein